MSLATVVAGAAKRALGTYGAPATLTHKAPGAYDPATGGASVTTTTTSVRALLDASSTTVLGFKFGQDLVRAGDMLATVTGVVPVEGDTLTLAMGTFTVIQVRPVYVQATQVLAECLVRR